MLTRRALAAALATLLAVPLAAGAARAEPPRTTTAPSAVGDGSVSPDDEYVGSANPDPDLDVTAGQTRDDACTALAGGVSAADVDSYQQAYRSDPPRGEGKWRYLLCAETSAARPKRPCEARR